MTALQASIRISLLDQFSGPLRGMASNMDRFKKTLGGVKFPSVARFAADLNQAGEAMSRVGQTITGALKSSVDEFAEVQSKMSRLKAIGGFDPAEMKQADQFLTGEAERAGFKVPQVVDLAIDYAAIGKSLAEIKLVAPLTLDIAKIEGIAPGEVAEKFGTSAHVLGIHNAPDLSGLSDAMVGASAISKATFSGLSEFVAEAGTIGKTLGFDVPTILAFGTALDEAGIKAADASTGFRNISLRFANITKPAREAFASIGMGADDIERLRDQINRGDMIGALRDMGQAMEGMTGLQKEGVLGSIFESFTAVPALKLIEATMDPASEKSLQTYQRKFREMFAAGQAGANKTGAMAREMTDNLSGDMKRAGSAVAGLQKRIGEILEPQLRELLSTFTELVAGIGRWAKANPELTATIVTMTAVLGGLAVAAGGAAFVLSGLSTGFGMVTKGLSVASSAVGVLGTVLSWAGRLPVIEAAIAGIGAALTGPVAIIAGLVAAVGLGAYYTLKWNGQLENVSAWFSERLDGVLGGLRAAGEFLVGWWVLIGRTIGTVVGTIFGVVVGVAELAVGAVVGAWKAAGAFIGGVFDQIGAIGTVIGKLLGDLLGTDAVQWVMRAWEPIGEFFSRLWGGIADAFDTMLGGVFSKITGLVGEVRSIGRGKIESVFGGADKAKPEGEDKGEDTGPLASLYKFLRQLSGKQKSDQSYLFDLSPNTSHMPEKESSPFDLIAEAQRIARDALDNAKMPALKMHQGGGRKWTGEVDDTAADADYYEAQKAYQDSMGADNVVARYPDGSRDERREDGTVVRVQPPSAPAARAKSAKSGGVKLPKVAAPEFAPPVIAEAKPKAEPGLLPPNPYDGETLGELPANPYADTAIERPLSLAPRRGENMQPVEAPNPMLEELRAIGRRLDQLVSETREMCNDADAARTEHRQLGDAVLGAMREQRELLHRFTRANRPLTVL